MYTIALLLYAYVILGFIVKKVKIWYSSYGIKVGEFKE